VRRLRVARAPPPAAAEARAPPAAPVDSSPILQATYHDADVTAALRAHVGAADRIVLGGGGGTFNRVFGDPAFGVVKRLRVSLADGRQYAYREGDAVDIPLRRAEAIAGATYDTLDVTARLRAFVGGAARLVVAAGHSNLNDIFGDPRYGAVKVLRVTLADGRRLAFSEHDDIDVDLRPPSAGPQ
jgi:hypothetical protein